MQEEARKMQKVLEAQQQNAHTQKVGIAKEAKVLCKGNCLWQF